MAQDTPALVAIPRWQDAFGAALEAFWPDEDILVVTHHDADGLAAAAILHAAFQRLRRRAVVRILGRGENPWTEAIHAELKRCTWAGLIVVDLGTRPVTILPGTPTVIMDHHVPLGLPPDATVISGYGFEPAPTSGLLAWWCVRPLAEVEHLLWLAALSIIGDLGEKAPFAELTLARERYGLTPLRAAASLLNSARRAGAGHAQPAFDLLLKAHGPHDVTSGKFAETTFLLRAKEEVTSALNHAKRVAPKVQGPIALIRLHSPCQVHPLIAQMWRHRLRRQIVLVANTGYRPGWVHFSARSATGANLIEFLKRHAPSSADENYGSGHEQATGGALRYDAWNEFVSRLGFGPEMHV